MTMPKELMQRFQEFEGAILGARSNVALATEFNRLYQETRKAFGQKAMQVQPRAIPDFMAVDETTRWPPP